jgi:hypothetical protein
VSKKVSVTIGPERYGFDIGKIMGVKFCIGVGNLTADGKLIKLIKVQKRKGPDLSEPNGYFQISYTPKRTGDGI